MHSLVTDGVFDRGGPFERFTYFDAHLIERSFRAEVRALRDPRSVEPDIFLLVGTKPELQDVVADHPEGRGARSRAGLWWLLPSLLAVPVGLAAWRIVGLGYGTTDLAAHFLLDLLVTACLVLLLSGPLRGRPPLPLLYAVSLLALALYVGWLYVPAGFATAAFLFAATMLVGFLLRLLREKLSVATFLRSGWMNELDLGSSDVPADAVYTQDPLTGGYALTWRRYVAFPVICGLLLAFVAVRIARPLDKRAEARAVLETGEPYKIATAFLKAATNGNAPLFVRENVPWFVKPDRRTAVMEQAGELFASFKQATRALALDWVDLGALPGRERRPGPNPQTQTIQTCAGRAVAWLSDPEQPLDGLDWVDASRPHRGFYVYVAPLDVTLEKTAEGLRVVGVSTTLDISLRNP